MKIAKLLLLSLFLLSLGIIVSAGNLDSDTWMATDALGRKLPGYADCGPPRADRTVGIFYFLWHGYHRTPGPYDITQILAANPTNPEYGPRPEFHWWGEPEAGYFRSRDPYVARRSLSMLADAGVDVLFFDITNGWTYKEAYLLICQIASEMKANGQNVPKIGFMSWWINEVIVTVYNDLYSQNLYKDLWFYWQGKPLWLGNKDGTLSDGSPLPQHIKDFFTWRQCWFEPFGYNAGYHKWTWGSWYPQNYAWDVSGVPEQCSVLPATHPISNIGRSCRNNTQPPIDQYKTTPTAGHGFYFADQWQRALEIDPQFLFVTGWNEWVAQRFTIPEDMAPGGVSMCGTRLWNEGDSYFIDDYNHEYSRDIEPMKDGHTDNYYYQMVAGIRKFKGVKESTPPSEPKTVTINGTFSDWDDVQPEYLDTVGDPASRNYAGWGDLYYTNNTGGNDIVKSKVARDLDYVYFYVETKANITTYSQGNWMLLFIDADCNAATGWNGYDYLVNYSVTSSTTTTLWKHTGSGWNWDHVTSIPYRRYAKKMELAVPRLAIGKTQSNIAFDFKWADNVFNSEHPAGSISAFFVNGDVAPNRRFNYRYATFTPGPTWEYVMDGNLEGWYVGNKVSNLRVSGGSMLGTISGTDPQIIGPRYPDIDATNNRHIHIRMKSTASGTAEFFWRTPAEPFFSSGRRVGFTVTGDGLFRDYWVNMSTNPQWTGTVHTLRFDPAGSSGSFEVDFIRVLQTPPDFDTQPPSAPTNVVASAQSVTSVLVTWTASTDNVGVIGYRICRNGIPVGSSETADYLDTGLQHDTTYSYTVSAYDDSGNNSEESFPPAVVSTPPDTEPPSVPADVQGTAYSMTVVQLTWTASTDNLAVAGYRIYRDGSPIGENIWPNYTNTGLQSGTTYTYTVTAYDGTGNESAHSSPPTVVTTPSVPDFCSVDLGSTDLSSYLTRINYTTDGSTGAVIAGGLNCRQPSNTSNQYFYFAIDDIYIYNGSVSTTYLEVCYYDDLADTAFIEPQYDSNSGAYTSLPQVALTGTGEWKTATWTLTDCLFANRQNGGADFRLFVGPNSVKIDSVRISKSPFSQHLSVERDLGVNEIYSGLSHPQYTDGNTMVQLKDGVYCKKPSTSGNNYFYFNVSDAVIYDGSCSIVELKVGYYDGESGSITPEYDSTLGEYTSAETLNFAGTNTWKENTWTLTDVKFANRQNASADFRLYVGTAQDVFIDTMVVAKVFIPDNEPPSVPENVQAAGVTPSAIRVTWDESTDNVGVDGYRIYRNGTPVGTSETTSFTDTGLTAVTTYSYRVSAFDAAGNESNLSSTVTAATITAIDITAAKDLPDTLSIGMLSQIVTAVFDGYLYVGEIDRHSGIRIVPIAMPAGVGVGSIIDVGGTLQTVDGERRIVGASVHLRQ